MDFEKSKKPSKNRANCKCCCCLLFALVIAFLSVAATVLFGVFFYRLSINGDFLSIREKITKLEAQLNQSQDAVSALQVRAINTPSTLMDQVSTLQVQLLQVMDDINQISTQQVQEVDAEFMQTLANILNPQSQAMDFVTQYSMSTRDNFTSAISSVVSDYGALSRSHIEATLTQLYNDSAVLLDTVSPLPINDTTQRTTYTRWGNSTCPDVSGTTLVYSGYAGGSPYFARGGGANILCLPTEPELNILPIESGVHDVTRMYGSEYESEFLGSSNENVPCAVCSISSRPEVIMIPAKVNCSASWTREYYGYLMSEGNGNHRTSFICVDEGMEFIPGQTGHMDGCDLWLVEPSCDSLPCPPYNAEKELACVVCSK